MVSVGDRVAFVVPAESEHFSAGAFAWGKVVFVSEGAPHAGSIVVADWMGDHHNITALPRSEGGDLL